MRGVTGRPWLLAAAAAAAAATSGCGAVSVLPFTDGAIPDTLATADAATTDAAQDTTIPPLDAGVDAGTGFGAGCLPSCLTALFTPGCYPMGSCVQEQQTASGPGRTCYTNGLTIALSSSATGQAIVMFTNNGRACFTEVVDVMANGTTGDTTFLDAMGNVVAVTHQDPSMSDLLQVQCADGSVTQVVLTTPACQAFTQASTIMCPQGTCP